jgi:transcriptional regulator with XRE-family HTH domain
MPKVRVQKVIPNFKPEPRFRPAFIRQWRKHRGITQERLADRAGMSPGNLSNIETGKQPYTQGHMEALADALNCEVVDLLVRDPSDPEGIWTLWERARPAERQQIVRVAQALIARAK